MEKYTVPLGTDHTGKYIRVDLVNSPVNLIVGGENKPMAVRKFLYTLNNLEDNEVKIHFISNKKDNVLQDFSEGSAKVQSYISEDPEKMIAKLDEIIELNRARAELFIEHNADSIEVFYYSEHKFKELPLHFVLIRENEIFNDYQAIEERLVTLTSDRARTGIALLFVEDEFRESESFQQIEENLTTLIRVDDQGRAHVEGLNYMSRDIEL